MPQRPVFSFLAYAGTRDRPATASGSTAPVGDASLSRDCGQGLHKAVARTEITGHCAPPAVEVSDLRVHYATQADPVLSIHHLTVTRGERLALTGANGAGKSTLLKALTGLVRADSGSVRIFGLPPERARGCIAYLPQLRAVDWQYPISVADFALLGCAVRLGWLRRPGAQWRARTRELLKRLQLDDLSERPIRALSGGEQQRLLLVRALLADPDLFLLDEPLTAVDAQSVELIGEILETEHRAGKTLIVATHHTDFGCVFRFDRELQLHCGCVHAEREGEDALSPARTLARQLSAPLTFRSPPNTAKTGTTATKAGDIVEAGTTATRAGNAAEARRTADKGNAAEVDNSENAGNSGNAGNKAQEGDLPQ